MVHEPSDASVERIRSAVLQHGIAPRELRASALTGDGRDAGSARLVEGIRTAAHRVTDADVADLRQRLASDRAAFEVIVAASIGAGLERRTAALDALEEAVRAAP